MISVALLLALSAAPLADLSPFAVKRQADGSLEYSYDLTGVKALASTADAVALHGEDKVKAFLKALPRSMKVVVAPGSPLELGAGRALESGRLATSFATVPDGPMGSDNPLAEEVGSKLRAPLDPSEPHLLLSAEAIAWQLRQLELSALAAEQVDTEALRRELWNRVLERALASHQAATQGDAREGALALVARVSAATACLDRTKVPAAVRADADASLAVDAEISRLSESPDSLLAPVPWSWNPQLQCAWVRARAIAQPFERTRGGTAAVLLFLDLLAKEPKVAALWDRVRSRRDRFLGPPAGEPILLWREKAAGKPGEAIFALNEFIESLPQEARVPPPLVAAPVTPFGKFLGELSGAERSHAFAELATALQDGRVVATPDSWPAASDAALAALCLPEANKSLRYDGAWSDRLQGAFAALLGSNGEARGDNPVPERDDAERSELKIRLLVPPALEVEPVPELFARGAQALEKLIAALQAEQLTGLQALGPDGQRAGPIVATAKVWAPRLKGLAALANPEMATAKELAEGRRLAAAWRSEPAFSREVREASASPVSMPGERHHAAIVGVSRREFTVSFAKPPKLTPATSEAFIFTPSEQRYIVPVLVTVGATSNATKRPLDRQALKALVDGAGRDASQAEGAFAEALKP
ncbi:MAG: hypothetical protein Q8L48_11505 [Archangium sp.]|nr:hypothetical protein [Archangium sp.]